MCLRNAGIFVWVFMGSWWHVCGPYNAQLFPPRLPSVQDISFPLGVEENRQAGG